MVLARDGEPKGVAGDGGRAIADRATISARADIDVGEADRLVWRRGAGADGFGRVHVEENNGALGGANGGSAEPGGKIRAEAGGWLGGEFAGAGWDTHDVACEEETKVSSPVAYTQSKHSDIFTSPAGGNGAGIPGTGQRSKSQ